MLHPACLIPNALVSCGNYLCALPLMPHTPCLHFPSLLRILKSDYPYALPLMPHTPCLQFPSLMLSSRLMLSHASSPQDTSENLNEWASPDGAFPFPPTPRLLFYPAAIPVRVEPFRCPPPLPPVYARPGVFLTARITPALPGVNLSVVADSASDAGSWQEGELVGWRLTEGWHGGEKGRRDLGESDGEEGRVAGAGMEGEDNTEEVVLGPLYDDASYHLELNKEGYIFSSTGDNSFTAERVEPTQQICKLGSSSSGGGGGEEQECKWQS
ncbi:unnamed protein product [Closterium sp. NIES-53]